MRHGRRLSQSVRGNDFRAAYSPKPCFMTVSSGSDSTARTAGAAEITVGRHDLQAIGFERPALGGLVLRHSDFAAGKGWG